MRKEIFMFFAKLFGIHKMNKDQIDIFACLAAAAFVVAGCLYNTFYGFNFGACYGFIILFIWDGANN